MRSSILLAMMAGVFAAGCAVTGDLGRLGFDPTPVEAGTDASDNDAGTLPPPIDPGDAGTPDAQPSTKFFLMVTQTPPGDAPINTWGGVARYDIADDGMNAVQGQGIDASKVRDPAGLAFRSRSAELFVGNRHGNNAADGTLGSISRFTYDKNTEKFTPNGQITGNGLARVHQLAFNPKETELFAANRDGGISRFTFDKNGNPVANGVLSASGWIRGVAVSPSGKRLYATTAGSIIRQFDLANNGVELATVSVPDVGANLHFMSVVGDDLYAPGTSNNYVYRFKIQNDDSLALAGTVTADNPISIALSPSHKELFAAGHIQSDLIDRFKASNSAWSATTKITTGWSLGMILVFASDSTPSLQPW